MPGYRKMRPAGLADDRAPTRPGIASALGLRDESCRHRPDSSRPASNTCSLRPKVTTYAAQLAYALARLGTSTSTPHSAYLPPWSGMPGGSLGPGLGRKPARLLRRRGHRPPRARLAPDAGPDLLSPRPAHLRKQPGRRLRLRSEERRVGK